MILPKLSLDGFELILYKFESYKHSPTNPKLSPLTFASQLPDSVMVLEENGPQDTWVADLPADETF